MRFASLALERYGHFEDCELSFRTGAPDLHVVYGANEAGKTTSMAAVSDLLFGFLPRSPYNFIYDYSLLRIGALIEDGERTLACRRKKGTSGTLLGPDDRPIDEGGLLAMLRGQTRETFGLSFSLNQEGLRAGGRAMVEARNDIGRALFAAGSGLTGVSDELSRLEAEADAIWGPRASNRRSFTVAQREFETHARVIRDQSLKPKTWLDARSAASTQHGKLTDAQHRRDEILAEVSRAERIRRIAPSARVRADYLVALSEHDATIAIAPHSEEAAEKAMAEADAALRARAAALKLAAEAKEKIDALPADQAMLDEADRVDELVRTSGAIAKARQDQARLESDLAAGAALILRLQEETGSAAMAPPSRIVSSKLRELALAEAQAASALIQIEQSEEELEQRRSTLGHVTDDVGLQGDAHPLLAAVDAARALGADVDARCVSSERKAELAANSLEHCIARLVPWRGDARALLSLPRLTPAEIEEARRALADLATEAVRDETAAVRAREEAAALSLEMEQLSSGAAIPADEIASARLERSERWQPLREHVLGNAPLGSPEAAVAAFEAKVAHADDRSDLRFAAAEESSRLADMGQRCAKLLLDANQAKDRAVVARARAQSTCADWSATLEIAGYPDMEPARMLGWLTERDAAEKAHHEAAAALAEAKAFMDRRSTARLALVASLHETGMIEGVELAPVLATAELARTEIEKADQQHRLDRAARAQIELDAEALARRRKRLEDAAAARAEAWRELTAASGLRLEISGAIATLDVLDELRAAVLTQSDLEGRIDGVTRDANEHERSVASVADRLRIAPAQNAEERLAVIRNRLAEARSAANVRCALQATLDSRTSEVAAEEARYAAALDALEPLMAEMGSADLTALGAAIQRSRAARALRSAVTEVEAMIKATGDGKTLGELLADVEGVDADSLAARTQRLRAELAELNEEVAVAASAHGDAKRVFASLEAQGVDAAGAATGAEQARAELGVLADHYILKRAQAVTLRWAIEQYRERHQDPMLLRAGEIFSTLTLGRYAALRIDNDGSTPRLLGLRDDRRTVVEVDAMSEGTTDQLFLALRLAAVEQSVAAGVRLPFLADDLFVNFDDQRSEAGFRVLAELARSTQVLFFTHHIHLASIARSVVGADAHSECQLA
ncbi:YhaN family protein [Sphingomonas sp. SRS2]|uniref:YhaN family protein n=1 Tax=Sphingomonas sp. SRS2 TaxID=133190 RepID=UPI0006184F10|nr:YhaN family protein [Sphingomonas sp. SRS2]KKC27915.1 chromosome partition protein smc [Sphingomonas sp. SRS2]